MLYHKLNFLKYTLLPIQIIYSIIIFLRNELYHKNIFKSFKTYPTIISVGNLNTGGTGKTPMTEYLIKLFKNKKVAVLSRGYKRLTKEFIIANNEHTASEIGDEMHQLYRKFQNILIACDKNRANGIRNIINHNSNIDLILLDDAFQHRSVNRDIDILLTEYGNLYSRDQLLPIGRLREHVKEAKRANIIIITKCPENISEKEMNQIRIELKLKRAQKIYFSYIQKYTYIDARRQKKIKINLNKRHLLLTGIANSLKLVHHLKESGLKFKHFNFNDHYIFQNNDISKIITSKTKHQLSKNLLLTEKDYYRLSEKDKIKLEKHFNLVCIQIKFDFIQRDKLNFNNELLNFKKHKTTQI
ncbi:MAG: tetraacyldisaccharide 4'-kinase [Flavobacteriales bacterium]|nr:tetraacyldisaccharide 4'-kinase [Flavobacteriales bacterium]